MSILQNEARIGNFTSSEIWKLTTKDRSGKGFGKPALTYIKQKKYERRSGLPLSNETNAKALSWGNFMESIVFEKLGTQYVHSSQETVAHPKYPFWVGSTDGFKEVSNRAVIDFKNPLTRLSFFDLVEPIILGLNGNEAMDYICENHDDGIKFKNQLVSNACIHDCDYAELIIHMPFKSEIPNIKAEAEGDPKMMWLTWALENEIPFINDGGFYKDVYTIAFEVKKEDKDFLENCVLKAASLLI
jgi:hypothetical protein